ncbi:unnamed protein product [Protopolystoma xenopodis]|uniref:Uncharacterized protein n=1 Tax=Protopolystoma xenopodis TaxID=117903 RepID=A0A3S5AI44_9PLAT|nr:unnamed protein product [Protopolystoma xenopodis]
MTSLSTRLSRRPLSLAPLNYRYLCLFVALISAFRGACRLVASSRPNQLAGSGLRSGSGSGPSFTCPSYFR